MADGACVPSKRAANACESESFRFAIVVTPLRPKSSLRPLIRALAGQTGVGEGRITVFAAVGDRLGAAASAFEAVGDGALALHLIDGEPTGSAAGECHKVLEAAAFHLERQTKDKDPVLLVIDSRAVPAPDWIAINLRALEEGADLVCGNPVPRAGSGRSSSTIEAMVRYRQLVVRLEDMIDPVEWDQAPRHRDESGASLAFRLSRLTAAGGVPDVPAELLRHLIARIRQSGGVIRHCSRCRVFVPPHMLADRKAELRLPDAETPMPVTDPAELEAHFRDRAWQRHQLERQYAELAPDARDRAVRSVLALDGAAVAGSSRAIPVEQACAILRKRLDELGGRRRHDVRAVPAAVPLSTRWKVHPRVS